MNLKRYESYIDFIYWKKNQKAKINPINCDKKWIRNKSRTNTKNLQEYQTIKAFVNKRIKFSQGKELLLMCLMIKNEYIPSIIFKAQLKSYKTNHSFNDSIRRRMALSCSKKSICTLRGITSLCKLYNYFHSPITKSKLEYHKRGILK